ncbi:MAG TPA: GNAT family N-acetyltransferase [Xanthobacteraceae bacterium]|nr:GNAT family N-acetyltransferase [Xanthobacteraceae bacterium]
MTLESAEAYLVDHHVENQDIARDLPDDKWHAAMSRFSDIHYEQTAIHAANKRSERTSNIVVRKGGVLLGGARVGLLTVPIINRGLALVRFGPFWRRSGTRSDEASYRTVVQALIDEYCTRRKLYLIVRPRPHLEFYPVEARLLEELGFRGSQSSVLDHYFVNVALSADEQKKSLDKRWRYNLKLGDANDLNITISDDEADFRTFQKIYAEMVERKRLNYPGVDLPQAIPDLVRLPSQMKMRVALAHHDGEAVAGAVFSIVGDLAYYVFGATNDKATELQAGYILQWRLVEWLRDNGGITWCDLGGTGDRGIQQFKKGLAGKRGALLTAQEFHYSPSPTATAIVKGMFAVRNARNKIQSWQRA